MDDSDDRDNTGGAGADRPTGRGDQLRIVGAEEAAARAGAARRGRRESAAEPVGPRSVTPGFDDDGDDDLGSLRGPHPRSAFDSIPDAPPSFLDDLVSDDDPTVIDPRSARAAATGGPQGPTGPGAGPDDVGEQPQLFAADRDDEDAVSDEYDMADRTVAYGPGDADDEPTVGIPPAAAAPSDRPGPGRQPGPGRDLPEHASELRPAAEPPDDEAWPDDEVPDIDEIDEIDEIEADDADDSDDDRDTPATGPTRATRAGQPPTGASPAEVDPNRFGAVPVIRVGPAEADSGEAIGMPHWTEPPTGQVPKVLVDEDRRDEESWSTYGSAPRWRDPSSEWAASEYSDVSDLGDDLPRVGALDEGERPSLDEFFSFEDIDSGSARAERPAGEAATPPGRTRRRSEPGAGGGPPSGEHPVGTPDAGRDMPLAVGAGVAIAVLFVVLLRIGPAATLGLVVVAVAVAAAELMATTRRAGHHPAALVGLAAAAGLPLAVYWRGEAAYPLVLFLAVAFSLFWFLFGVDTERPAQNVGLTLLAVCYVGLFGSFAALMLRVPSPLGTNLLLAAAIPTVAADIGAFVVGRNAGRSPLTPISPSKTVEGALGGFAAAVTASVVLNHFVLDLQPFDGLWDSAMLGVVVGIVSLLGDLCESLLKRSLGVKDMGTIIPGHGGVLDRMDALLFVLPATYYLALLLDLIPA